METGISLANSNKSRSPVTSTSALASIAAARTQRSSGSYGVALGSPVSQSGSGPTAQTLHYGHTVDVLGNSAAPFSASARP
jgi:hypothetical protein